jgi:DNA-binding MarR family transcriptional regulator
MTDRDAVDAIQGQWRTERPDIDTGPVGIVGRITRASRLLERSTREHLATHHLQPWEYDVLAALRRSGRPYELTAGQLVATMIVTSGAITNRIDHLTAKGLVDRNIDPDNRRSVLISLTPKGKTLIDHAVVAHVDNEEQLLAPLPQQDREQLTHLLRKLLVGLGDTA